MKGLSDCMVTELLPHMHFAPGLWLLAQEFHKKLFKEHHTGHAAAHLRRGDKLTVWPNPLTGEHSLNP